MSAADRMRRAGSGEDFIALVLSEHAHELAEKQRGALGRCWVHDDDPCGSEYCEKCYARKVIDLIDPEVSNDAG